MKRTLHLQLSPNQAGTNRTSETQHVVYFNGRALKNGEGVRGAKVTVRVRARRSDNDVYVEYPDVDLKTDKNGRVSGSVTLEGQADLVEVEITGRGGKRLDRFGVEIRAGRTTDCRQDKGCMRFQGQEMRYEVSVTWTPEGGQVQEGVPAGFVVGAEDDTLQFRVGDGTTGVAMILEDEQPGIVAGRGMRFNLDQAARAGEYRVRVRCVGGS